LLALDSERQQPATEPNKPAPAGTGSIWRNTGSGSRHNEGCSYYKNTKRGKPCGANEERAGSVGVIFMHHFSA